MEEAFLAAVNKHQGIIFKICRMYCRDNTDSEDLFQEIILQLWKSWPGFNSTAKVSTWIYRIGLNTAITGLRKNNRRPPQQGLSAGHNAIPEASAQRLDILFDKELQAAIDQLDKLDKALVMLYLDEKTYREIAEIMGLSEGNVGVKMSRIKVKLKKILNR
ncbi:RNA polymerase sigma-70 factor (ECF subfamily) [Anseongella ginsenosidimutans]|uniref:RNA polymerase sigma-70 factor (ECF subfamily) n=1 Tax=Anseongella ginsenosidimutans TaxID=496056 RepID=A0A4R3KX86_9SPHI|nr:sigma-70 family RNA polymerase sigma factor [Anseongella ginsenosidimutans]QEC51727.1 sigma-70 family RNA polymerase sigma factor [Anseongella ginsenosidimutans]TCS89090.1 RNA polymerase sigma-70 factor (ECF subfamily) [Anseongella ginsenosidimutans]